MQSNQTITYTLTPENMRNFDPKNSLDSPVVTKGSRKAEDAMAHNRSRSSSAADARRSPPHRTSGFSDDRNKPLPSPHAAKSRLSAAPRDARVPSESTADFAEFIKSTGPTGDNRPAPLRNGPQSANNHRIPRTVAPFRNTFDSEEMSGAIGGKAVDASIPDIRYSQASTHGTDTSSTMPSIHSSINSSTALLKNRGGPAPSNKMFDDDDMMPKRKTRRVKDPYAIDFSDEDDEDDFITTPKVPVKREESLAEFLRNYDPPPEPVAEPISHKIPKKKASAPSLIGRFTRKDSNQTNSVPQSPLGNDTRPASSRGGIRGYIPIHVNMSSPYDKYGSPADSGPPQPTSQTASSMSSGRVPMKRFEPRDAVSNVSRTSDLAAFLRTSAPPPEPAVVATPPPKEEGSSFSRMFGRRKK